MKFTFFENFKETADKLPDEMRLKFYDALTDYVFKGIEPDDAVINALVTAFKPSLDKEEHRGGAREGAGAPKGNQNSIKNNQKQSNIFKNNQINQSFQKIEDRSKKIEERNIKENTKRKEFLEEFEDFWQHYVPVRCDGKFVDKGSKKTAYEKFVKILEKGESYENIIGGLKQYIAHCQANGQLTCGATVFLNQERWKCDYASTINSNGSTEHGQPRSILETYSEIARKYQ